MLYCCAQYGEAFGACPVPSAEELGKSLTELVVLSGKVAAIPSADKGTVDKAHALRLEWVRLQQSLHTRPQRTTENRDPTGIIKKAHD
jgi:hypothetical protein